MTSRVAAWILAASIVFLTLAPPALRPITGVPHDLEHFGVFAATSFAFGCAYGRWYLVIAALMAFAGVMEVGQYFVPGRHARLQDFIVDEFATCIGFAASYVVLHSSKLISKFR